jgi:hypothetical protein
MSMVEYRSAAKNYRLSCVRKCCGRSFYGATVTNIHVHVMKVDHMCSYIFLYYMYNIAYTCADVVVPHLTLGESEFTMVKSYFVWAQSN